MERLRAWWAELRQHRERLVAAIAVVVIVIGAAGYGIYQFVGPAQRGVLPLPPTQFVQGEFLVKFKPGAARSDIAAFHAQNKVQEIDTIPGIGVNHLKVPAGSSVGEMVNAYLKNPNVEFAEP